MKRIAEWALNVICIIALVCTGVACLHGRWWHRNSPASSPTKRSDIGSRISIPAVSFSHQRNLVLVLSTTCHYCSASAPFYARLLEKAKAETFQPIAVFPQPISESRLYMASHGYNISNVRQMDFSTLGITSTPTLLLVDDQGKIEDEWIGQLQSRDEADVAAHLGVESISATSSLVNSLTSPSKSPNEATGQLEHEVTTDPTGSLEELSAGKHPQHTYITTAELREDIAHPKAISIIDVRERAPYNFIHLQGALNIPASELIVRGPHEIDPTKPILLFCNFSPSCQQSGTPDLCTLASDDLKAIGLTNAEFIRDRLSLLENARLPVYRANPITKEDVSARGGSSTEPLIP